MTYDEWADEYVRSAEKTLELIEKYRRKKRSCKNTQLLYFYSGKLQKLEEMYADCMYSAAELRRKAARDRKRGIMREI